MGGSMSSLVIYGDTSGSVSLQAPAVANTTVLTLPTTTGTLALTSDIPSGSSGPAFRVYVSNSQSIPSNVETTVQFTSKTFDTANCYSTSTYRFTPTVAGYYQFNFSVAYNNNAVGANGAFIYKNGVKDTVLYELTTTSNTYTLGGSGLIYANGTTDYFYINIYQVQGSDRPLTSYTIWSGFLARAA